MPCRSAQHCLVILLRYPEIGKVKSRIARAVGEKEALRVYQELVSITLDIASHLHLPVYLMYEGRMPEPEEQLHPFHYRLQPEGALDQKIIAAFHLGFTQHAHVIVIGSDCPELQPNLIEEAFVQITNTDVVIGPAKDGGYYLIGCKKMNPRLFSRISWGSDQVLKETVDRCEEEHLRYTLLPELQDVDTIEDWESYKIRIQTVED